MFTREAAPVFIAVRITLAKAAYASAPRSFLAYCPVSRAITRKRYARSARLLVGSTSG